MILEAYVTSLVKKEDEIIENFSTSLNEDKLTKEVTDFLKNKGLGDDLIQKVIQALKGDLIDKIIKQIVDRVNPGNKEIEEVIFASLRKSDASTTSKVKALRKMLRTSLIDFNKLKSVNTKNLDLMDLFSDEIKVLSEEEQQLITDIGSKLIHKKVSKVGEGSTGTGKGEIFLAVFGNGTLNCKGGDICLDGNPIEVKGANGRISTIGGKSLFQNWKDTDWAEKFKEQGLNIEKTNQGNITKLWNKSIGNKEKIYKILKEFYLDTLIITPIAKKIQKSNSYPKFLETEDFANFKKRLDSYIYQLGILIFDYYQQKEGFCCLLSMYETKNGAIKAKMFHSSKDLEAKNIKTMGITTNGNNPNYIVINA